MSDADYNAKEPAHPIHPGGAVSVGLTKREYFAGLAMQGLMSKDQSQHKLELLMKEKNVSSAFHLASVLAADALLASLSKARGEGA